MKPDSVFPFYTISHTSYATLFQSEHICPAILCYRVDIAQDPFVAGLTLVLGVPVDNSAQGCYQREQGCHHGSKKAEDYQQHFKIGCRGDRVRVDGKHWFHGYPLLNLSLPSNVYLA
jgi:hypothetical protein